MKVGVLCLSRDCALFHLLFICSSSKKMKVGMLCLSKDYIFFSFLCTRFFLRKKMTIVCPCHNRFSNHFHFFAAKKMKVNMAICGIPRVVQHMWAVFGGVFGRARVLFIYKNWMEHYLCKGFCFERKSFLFNLF